MIFNKLPRPKNIYSEEFIPQSLKSEILTTNNFIFVILYVISAIASAQRRCNLSAEKINY